MTVKVSVNGESVEIKDLKEYTIRDEVLLSLLYRVYEKISKSQVFA